ncbi:hypothetical protein Tco_1071870 [Tanacetum coccineum]
MAGKSRSFVLDDLGSGGPMRRIRQKANLHPAPLLISSQPTWELEGSNGSKMPGKSRSSVLDDLGSGGPMRRTRQKTPSLISSQPAWELEGSNGSKMAGKRRSYVLDDLGSGGPMRRIWQKADLCSQKKKRPFQMSAREDDLFELDDDDDTQVNGHMSLLLVESNKQKTALAADIVATSTLPGVSRTPALVEPPKKKPAFQMSAPEDDSFETDDDDETQVNGHVSLLPMDNVVPERDSNSFPLFSTSAERASPFASSANGLSHSKPSASSDPKALESTRLGDSRRLLLTTNTQNNSLPQATLPMDNVVPERDSNSFPLFGTSAERASPFASSANGLSDVDNQPLPHPRTHALKHQSKRQDGLQCFVILIKGKLNTLII